MSLRPGSAGHGQGAEKIRTVIVDDAAEARRGVASLLSFEPDIEIVGEAACGREAIALVRRLRPDIVLMDINMPSGNGIEATEAITTELPGVSVIIMSVQGEHEYLKEAMAAGAREYLVKPFSGQELVAAIRKVFQKEQQRRARQEVLDWEKKPRPQGKLITVFSTKGGVGKTTLATNLAVSLAKEGKARVVLVDLDLQFGDVCIGLDLTPRRTVADMAREDHVDAEVVDSYLIEHSSGVRVLPAPARPEQAEAVTAAHVEAILRFLRSSNDYIVVDTPQSLGDIVLSTLDASDFILLVATLDLPTIKNVKLCLELMGALNYDPTRIKVILNRSSHEVGVSVDELEKSIGRKVDFHIPSDGRVVVPSVNQGVPFVVSAPGTRVAQSIRDLAVTLLKETGFVPEPRGAGTNAPLPLAGVGAGIGLKLVRRRGDVPSGTA